MRRNNNNEFSVEFVPAGGKYQQKGSVSNQNRVGYIEQKRRKGFITKLKLILALVGLIASIIVLNIETLLKIISISRQKAKQEVYQETVLDKKEDTTITPEELAKQLAEMNNSSSPVVKERRNW